MITEQCDLILALVRNIHNSAMDLGFYADSKAHQELAKIRNAAAWQELEGLLTSMKRAA